MPVTIKPTQAIQVAQTPEFQKLQQQVAQAKNLLDAISNQIVSIEATQMNPGSARPPPGVKLEPTQNISPQPPTQESFEQSIAEMRRIAGLR